MVVNLITTSQPVKAAGEQKWWETALAPLRKVTSKIRIVVSSVEFAVGDLYKMVEQSASLGFLVELETTPNILTRIPVNVFGQVNALTVAIKKLKDAAWSVLNDALDSVLSRNPNLRVNIKTFVSKANVSDRVKEFLLKHNISSWIVQRIPIELFKEEGVTKDEFAQFLGENWHYGQLEAKFNIVEEPAIGIDGSVFKSIEQRLAAAGALTGEPLVVAG